MEVSVVITAHNYARYLGRAIRSLHDQSINHTMYEIIVINDASTDETKEVLADYESIARVIHLEENVGLAEARNIGIHKALGRYVVFIDADDYVHKDLLKIEHMFLSSNPALDAVSVDYILVDDRESHIERVSAEEQPIACGIMFRKDFLFDIGLYDKSFHAHEDVDLRIRFLEKYQIYNIVLPLYRYRKHGDNLTNNKKKLEKFHSLLKEKHGEKL